MDRPEITGIACPDCGNETINWDSDSISIDFGVSEIVMRGKCPRCNALVKAAARLCRPDLVIEQASNTKLDLPTVGKAAVSDKCRIAVKRLFKRYQVSIKKERLHMGGQGGDWDQDEWTFTLGDVVYTILEWGCTDRYQANQCNPEFIEYIQPGASKPPEILLRFFRALGPILFKYNAALDEHGLVFQQAPNEATKLTWDERR